MFSMYSFFLAKKLKSLNKQSSKEKKNTALFHSEERSHTGSLIPTETLLCNTLRISEV